MFGSSWFWCASKPVFLQPWTSTSLPAAWTWPWRCTLHGSVRTGYCHLLWTHYQTHISRHQCSRLQLMTGLSDQRGPNVCGQICTGSPPSPYHNAVWWVHSSTSPLVADPIPSSSHHHKKQRKQKTFVSSEFSTYRLWYYLMRGHPHSTWWSSAHHSNSWKTHCLSCSPSWFPGQWPQCGSQASTHDSLARPTLFGYSDILHGMRSGPRSSAHQYTLACVEVCCSWLKWGATEP